MGVDTLSPAPPEKQQLATRHKADLDVIDPDNIVIPDDIRELVPLDDHEKDVAIPEDPAKVETIRIVLAGLDNNVDSFAREAAHEKLAKKREGPFLKRFVKGVWHSLTREYQVVKETAEARQAILESGNLRHHHGEDTTDERWREATVRRMGSDFAEKLVREEHGETYHKLGAEEAEKDPDAERIRDDVNDLLKSYAKGEIGDKDSLEAMLDRLKGKWKGAGVSQQYIGEGEFLAHNVGSAGEQLIAAVDAAEGIDNLDRDALIDKILANSEIVLGEARVGSTVEIESTLSERLAKKLKGVPFLNEGRIARVTAVVGNEAFMAAVMSAVVFAANKGATAASAIPGLGAAIVGGIRERRAMLDERALMDRRRDSGQEIDPTSRRQKKLGETLYESRPAGELIDAMGALYAEAGDLKLTSRKDLDDAIRLQGEIQARLTIERREGARLINFSDISAENMEDRRFDLELASAKLEEDLKRLFSDQQEAALLNIQPDEKYDELFQTAKFIEIANISGEMEAADKMFNGQMRRRIMGRVLITFATVMGMQEAGEKLADELPELIGAGVAKIKEFTSRVINNTPNMRPVANYIDDSSAPKEIGTEGVPENIGTDIPETIGTDTAPATIGTEQAPADIGTDAAPETIGTDKGPTGGEQVVISDKAKVTLPEGFKAETGAGGDSVTVTGPKGETFTLNLEKDGTLPQSAIDALNTQGFNVGDHTEVVQGKPEIIKQEMAATEFAEKHKEGMVKIKHSKWYHNNTVGDYDLNELRQDNFKDADGNFVVSVKRMTSGGSFNGSSGVDWREAVEQGHLMVYLSASKGTQSMAFELPIGPDGTVTIDKDSPAGALFDEKGKFVGGYQEIAVKGVTTPEGATKIATLSTVVGKHSSTITDTISTPTFNTVHTYTITPEMRPASDINDIPFFFPGLPIYARTVLGNGQQAEQAPPPALTGDVLPPVSPLPGRTAIAATPGDGGGTPMALPAAPSPNAPPRSATNGQRGQNQPGAPGSRPGSNDNKKTGDYGGGPRQQQQSQGNQAGGNYNRDDNKANQGPAYTADERRFLDDLRAEAATVPAGFAVDFANVSTEAKGIAIKIIHAALADSRNARFANEGLRTWRSRIVYIVKRNAQNALSAIDGATPSMRPLYEQALQALLSVESLK